MSLQAVLEHIRTLELQAGRAPKSVRLVAVTKEHQVPELEQKILAHGQTVLGENRGQELRDKMRALERWPGLEWHFIGPLQRNKIKYLRGVRLIHAIEALWQAEAIAQAALAWGEAPALLLQVHNGEAQKHGIATAQLPGLLKSVQETGLTVRGLMAMAPQGQEGAAQRVFQDTALLAHTLGLPELSMGMSDDYPLAIQAGATLVRVGRRLFT